MAEWSREVFAKNLKYYMEKSGKNQKELAEIAGVSAPTFNEWIKGKKYPRIDKIEILAKYFNIMKSDLIEDNHEMKKNNDTIADIVIRLRVDADYLEVVSNLHKLNTEQLAGVKQMLSAFLK